MEKGVSFHAKRNKTQNLALECAGDELAAFE